MMRSKEVLLVFWTTLCCTQGSLLTNIQDYCTIDDNWISCKNLNLQSSRELEFDINNKLDVDRLYFYNSYLYTIPKNAFRISRPVREFAMRNCSLREIHRHNFDSGVNNTSTFELTLMLTSIERIPSRVFELLPALQVLILSYSDVKTIDSDSFFGLANLESLVLKNNLLQTLPNDVLEPLISLTEIDLENNLLEYLPRSIFSNNKQLSTVDISHNKLKIIDINIFKDKRALQYVVQNISDSFEPTHIDILNHPSLKNIKVSGNFLPYISQHSIPSARKLRFFFAKDCDLITIESGSFYPQTDLWWLDLSDNQLESLDLFQLSTMKSLEQIHISDNKIANFDYNLLAGNKNLKLIFVKNNPFTRNAQIDENFIQFMEERNITFDFEKL